MVWMAGDQKRQIKINVNEFEYDNIIIAESLKLFFLNNLSWAPDYTVSVLVKIQNTWHSNGVNASRTCLWNGVNASKTCLPNGVNASKTCF